MTELIQTHEQVNGGEEYLGFARQKLSVLNAARQATNLPSMRRVYEIGSARITVVSADSGNQIRIDAAPGGFVGHPRTDSFPGGVGLDGEPLELDSAFPLVDDDHGTSLVTVDEIKAEGTDSENYGNVVLLDENGPISWRGPSGGFVANSPAIHVPGFTMLVPGTSDQYTPGTSDQYTPFGERVYQGGDVIHEFPGKLVICSGFIDGKLAVVLRNGNNDELWLLENDWLQIGQRGRSLVDSPCLFDTTGVIFQDGKWFFDGGWSPYEAKAGTLNRGTGWSITKNVSDLILHPGIVGAFSSVDTTTVDDQWDKTEGEVQAKTLALGPVAISGPDNPIDGSQYTASGGTAPYTWQISQGSIDNNGWVSNLSDKCGSGTVIVTDSCGLTASKIVVFPSGGSWQTTTNYSLMHGETPVGKNVNTWYYVSPAVRFRLAANPTQHSGFTDSNPCGQAVVSEGWSGQYYRQFIGRDYTGCGGKTSSMFWPRGCTPDISNWLNVGSNGDCGCNGKQYIYFGSAGASGPFGCPSGIRSDPSLGEVLIELNGITYAWAWHGRTAIFWLYTCEVQEWVC